MKKILIVATSLDGFIAQAREQVSTNWTSAEDKKWFGKITKEIGAMVMGSTTFDTIGRALPERKTIIYTSNEEKYREMGAKNVQHFSPTDLETNLYTTGSISLTELMINLEKTGLEKVAICGGASVYSQAMAENQVDEIYLTVEPVFFGEGIKLFKEAKLTKLTVKEKIELSPQTTVFHLALV